jgi:hypothetical protein
MWFYSIQLDFLNEKKNEEENFRCFQIPPKKKKEILNANLL